MNDRKEVEAGILNAAWRLFVIVFALVILGAVLFGAVWAG